jgi:hypothetical protein
LNEHYDDTHGDEYYEPDEFSSDDDPDSDYEDMYPLGLELSDHGAEMLFSTNRILTRNMRNQILDRMGTLSHDMNQIWQGINYQVNLSVLFHQEP